MRKNKSMRAAALLLALTLITSCFVGGTFAKYVTSDSAKDSARVAKFGVVLTASDESSFETEYATDDNSIYKGELSVKSFNGEDKLVAPGTKDEDGITFSITGTPEVATKVDIEMTVNKDVVVKAGEHVDYTNKKGENFKLEEDYYPVVFTLTQDGKEVAKGNLAAIKTAVETYTEKATYAPNTNLAATFKLTWAWAFEKDENKDLFDKADTLLGNVAAETAADANVETNIDYEIKFTVTQID